MQLTAFQTRQSLGLGLLVVVSWSWSLGLGLLVLVLELHLSPLSDELATFAKSAKLGQGSEKSDFLQNTSLPEMGFQLVTLAGATQSFPAHLLLLKTVFFVSLALSPCQLYF